MWWQRCCHHMCKILLWCCQLRWLSNESQNLNNKASETIPRYSTRLPGVRMLASVMSACLPNADYIIYSAVRNWTLVTGFHLCIIWVVQSYTSNYIQGCQLLLNFSILLRKLLGCSGNFHEFEIRYWNLSGFLSCFTWKYQNFGKFGQKYRN